MLTSGLASYFRISRSSLNTLHVESPLITVNFSTFAKKGTRLLNHSVAASKALLSQVHVVQRQLIYLTTVCGIRPGQVDCKGAEIHCIESAQ